MSDDWPDRLKVAPIREWPGELTPASRRQRSQFKTRSDDSWQMKPTPIRSTLVSLDRELRMIRARDVELLVAIPPEQFKLDGRPRAQARVEHPGVILSFDTDLGHLSYPCDTFTTWQDNLRAITLALEALRRVDRYGVTKRGEQYRGFLAIEATAMPSTPFSHEPASIVAWLVGVVNRATVGIGRAEVSDHPANVLRKAQRVTHPDHGGDPEQFHLVTLAEQYLREAGEL